MSFEKIAPYLQDPLVLIGFILLLFFSLCRAILKSGLLSVIDSAASYQVIKRLLGYGFMLAALLVLLGFGLKYRELSKAEQARAINLLKQELTGNLATIVELEKNIDTIANNTKITSEVLRHKGIKIMSYMFSASNIDPHQNVPASLDLARSSLNKLIDENLLSNTLERQKFDAAAKVVKKTIEKTNLAFTSLSDSENVRYKIKHEIWKANLPVLRKIELFPVTEFQKIYREMDLMRNNYNVVVNYAKDYRDVLKAFFDPKSSTINEHNLAIVLASERIYITTSYEFLTKTKLNKEKIDKIMAELP
ncbi:MAG: hypothetical protein OIF58_05205 [Cohaesibacter sp.]|nr:hypothetical protein [Cohaesibacter sp.]